MITFSKDLLPLNPAYNDSIIEFKSNSNIQLNATIEIGGMKFVIYPINGKYFFNFKSIATTLINQNNFEDSIIPDLESQMIYPDSSIVKTLTAIIKVNTIFTNINETVTKNYKFIKAVHQLPFYNEKSKINKDVKLLLPSRDYTNYKVNYFEGYPFDFAINGINSGDTFYFKNITTNNTSVVYSSSTNDVKRVFLSDGGNDTTIDDVLLLSSTLNKIELWVNNSFKANIDISKNESQCGVYLKWFSSQGGYSYWKFDEVFETSLQTKSLEELNSKFDNLQNQIKTSNIIGKTANSTISLDTSFDSKDQDYLKDLLISPVVQMYIHTCPFEKMKQFDFINIKVNDGNFKIDNSKNSKLKMSLTITLPEINTLYI